MPQYFFTQIIFFQGFELTTLVVIGTDCTDDCKCNYHAITTMMALGCNCNFVVIQVHCILTVYLPDIDLII
jgi:hypothetical protein